MSDWSGGYVTSVEYVTACYPDQGPIHLDLMALLCGVEGPTPRGRPAYCELGAGQGLTATMIALTNPEIDVHAVDFMPAQVARAADLANSLGVENITFHEASFIDMAEGRGPALPNFDYVTMHGVYSWVSRENQQAIVRFLAQKLNPGGLVYTSYNAQPGWVAGIPIQRLLIELSSLQPGASTKRVSDAFGTMTRLFKADATHLANNPLAKMLVNDGTPHNTAYMAHEYLNQFWKPLFFADVARDYADAKLEYAGPARPIDLFDQLMMTPEQIAITNEIGDPIIAETTRDFCRMRTFRTDIHVKGARHLARQEQEARLAAVPLALTTGPSDFNYQLAMPVGVATLREETYRPIVEALAARGPTPLGELLSDPGFKGTRPTSILETVGMLLASRKVSAAVPFEDRDMVARCRLANRHSVHRLRELLTRDGVPVAAPALRNAAHVEPLEIVSAHIINGSAGISDADLVEGLLRLASRGELDLPTAITKDENPAALLGRTIAERRPIWRHLGLID